MDSEIAQLISENIAYWLRRCEARGEQTLVQLDAARHNITHAIQLGWRSEQTAVEAANLVTAVHQLVEQQGYQADWRPIVEQALANTDTQSNLHWVLQNQLGHLYRLDHNWQMATTIHQQVVAQTVSDVERAKARFHLGTICFLTHSYTEARQYGTQALAQFGQLGLNDDVLGSAQNLLGSIAHETGDYATATHYYEAAIISWAASKHVTRLARAYMNLGRTFTAIGGYRDALAAFDKALALLEHTPSDLDRVRIHLNCGVAFYELGLLDSAETAFRQANSAYLQRSGDHYLQAYTHHNLGSVLLELGQLDEAVDLLAECTKRWRQLENMMMLGDGLGGLAQAKFAQGEQEEAHQLIQQAIETLNGVGENVWAAEKKAELQIIQSEWLQSSRAE